MLENTFLNGIFKLREFFVKERRLNILANHLRIFIPPGANILDLGCGNGRLSEKVRFGRPDIKIIGIDIYAPLQSTSIPFIKFDGKKIPFPDRYFNLVLINDVLHHTTNQQCLLTEAKRVSARFLLIKDHLCEGILAHERLKFMDYVGNKKNGNVPLPYEFWTRNQWKKTFKALELKTVVWKENISLYPFPFSIFFNQSLHFITMLEITD
jgi:SAM-dependent methyltransferase